MNGGGIDQCVAIKHGNMVMEYRPYKTIYLLKPPAMRDFLLPATCDFIQLYSPLNPIKSHDRSPIKPPLLMVQSTCI